MSSDPATVQAIEALEKRRCAATAAADADALGEMFAPGMTMIHFRGKMQSGEDYITDVCTNRRTIEVGPMTIWVYGDTALAVGLHDITRLNPDGSVRVLIKSFATRLLQKTGDDWRYVNIQVSPMDF